MSVISEERCRSHQPAGMAGRHDRESAFRTNEATRLGPDSDAHLKALADSHGITGVEELSLSAKVAVVEADRRTISVTSTVLLLSYSARRWLC